MLPFTTRKVHLVVFWEESINDALASLSSWTRCVMICARFAPLLTPLLSAFHPHRPRRRRCGSCRPLGSYRQCVLTHSQHSRAAQLCSREAGQAVLEGGTRAALKRRGPFDGALVIRECVCVRSDTTIPGMSTPQEEDEAYEGEEGEEQEGGGGESGDDEEVRPLPPTLRMYKPPCTPAPQP